MAAKSVVDLLTSSGAFMLCGWSLGGIGHGVVYPLSRLLRVEWNELIYDQVICHMLSSRNGMN